MKKNFVKRILSLVLVLSLAIVPVTVKASALPEPAMPFPTQGDYAITATLPPDSVQTDEMIFNLFMEILNNNLIVDSNSQANKDYFRLVLQHTDYWGLYGDPNDYGGYLTEDGINSHINVSESQGYGMVMLAYMAGSEEKINASGYNWIYDCTSLQEYYNAMLRTVQQFPSSIGPHLFTWELFGYRDYFDYYPEGYKEEDGVKSAPFYQNPDDADNAIDGDMDIIYSLLLADKQWGSDGEYNYKEVALTMLADLWDYCVHKEYKTLLLGDWASVTKDEKLKNATRASDFMLDHLKAFAAADPSHNWQEVIDATYNVIGEIREAQIAEGNTNGFLPDFIVRGENGWEVPSGYVLEDDSLDGGFGYNSCRVPWRLGTDYLLNGDTEIGEGSLYEYCVEPLDVFARTIAGFGSDNDISRFGPFPIDAASFEEGTAPLYTEPSLFTAPFLVTAAGVGFDQEWVGLFYEGWEEWYYDEEAEDWLPAHADVSMFTGDTYSDYIKLLVLITASGNWWLPL